MMIQWLNTIKLSDNCNKLFNNYSTSHPSRSQGNISGSSPCSSSSLWGGGCFFTTSLWGKSPLLWKQTWIPFSSATWQNQLALVDICSLTPTSTTIILPFLGWWELFFFLLIQMPVHSSSLDPSPGTGQQVVWYVLQALSLSPQWRVSACVVYPTLFTSFSSFF